MRLNFFLILATFQLFATLPCEVVQKIEQHVSTCSWPEIYYDVIPRVIRTNQFKNILEVGVALGGHAETILKNCEIDFYYGVDPYRCYDERDGFQLDVQSYGFGKAQDNFDALFQWVKDIRLASFGKRCRLIRTPSVEASSFFEDESLDCIFIDGDHRYDAVLADLKAWYPKVKKGGKILGDDYWMEPVARAVERYFSSIGRQVSFEISNSGYRIWSVDKE